MDLEKKYYTVEGIECNILQLVKMEPEWAANRIQAGERAIKKLEKLDGGKGGDRSDLKNLVSLRAGLNELIKKYDHKIEQASDGMRYEKIYIYQDIISDLEELELLAGWKSN